MFKSGGRVIYKFFFYGWFSSVLNSSIYFWGFSENSSKRVVSRKFSKVMVFRDLIFSWYRVFGIFVIYLLVSDEIVYVRRNLVRILYI